jgi:hypothetical protein
MKESVSSLRERIYQLNLRIDKETYNPSSSRSEIRKLLKQKDKLEKQLRKSLD